jgi:hypothetical protein
MTQTQLLTGGAIGFAVFALWYAVRPSQQAVATSPAQQQRDIGLTSWFGSLRSQEWQVSSTAAQSYRDEMANILAPWTTTP